MTDEPIANVENRLAKSYLANVCAYGLFRMSRLMPLNLRRFWKLHLAKVLIAISFYGTKNIFRFSFQSSPISMFHYLLFFSFQILVMVISTSRHAEVL